jgi:hypothetical protein
MARGRAWTPPGSAHGGAAKGVYKAAMSYMRWARRHTKRPVTFGTAVRKVGGKEGPVLFRLPKNATPRQIANADEYCRAANRARDLGQLSPTGRVSTKGTLRAEADAAAAAERRRAARAGDAYGRDEAAAHLPDTTWTGTPDPPQGWSKHDSTANTILGSQSRQYPEGYKPTRFDYEVGDD